MSALLSIHKAHSELAPTQYCDESREWHFKRKLRNHKVQRHTNVLYPSLYFIRHDAVESKFAYTMPRSQCVQLGEYFASLDNASRAFVSGEYTGSNKTDECPPYRSGEDYFIEDVCMDVFENSQSLLVVYMNEQPFGFLGYSYSIDKSFVITLDYLYIIPDERGNGYSKALVYHLLDSLVNQLNRHPSWKAYVHYEINNPVADKSIRKAFDLIRPKLHKGYRFGFRTE